MPSTNILSAPRGLQEFSARCTGPRSQTVPDRQHRLPDLTQAGDAVDGRYGIVGSFLL